MNPKKSIVHLAENFGMANQEPESEGAKQLFEARKKIIARYVELANVEDAFAADETKSEEQRKAELASLAENRRDWAFQRAAEAQAAAIRKLSDHQKAVEAIFTPQSGEVEPRLSELRSRLAQMESGERMNVVRNALMTPDENADWIKAIATAPRELSGVMTLHYSEAKAAYAQSQKPDDWKAIREIKDGLATLEMASLNFEDAMRTQYIRPGKAIAEKQKAATAAISARLADI